MEQEILNTIQKLISGNYGGFNTQVDIQKAVDNHYIIEMNIVDEDPFANDMFNTYEQLKGQTWLSPVGEYISGNRLLVVDVYGTIKRHFEWNLGYTVLN